MPVSCPIAIPRLSDDEMRAIDYEVMGHAFAAHRELGRLCDESVYQFELIYRLRAAGLHTDREVPITLTFLDFSTTQLMDAVVQGKVIYELKTVVTLSAAHESQLLNYLFLTNATRGKLINFRTASVESRFANTTFDDAQRKRFEVDDAQWNGDESFADLIRSLLDDWGTGLDVSLYTQAMNYCLGGEATVVQELPMQSDGHSLGNQRFHLADSNTAFRITTYPKPNSTHANELAKLIRFSPLRQMYWVNITHHCVTLANIQKSAI